MKTIRFILHSKSDKKKYQQKSVDNAFSSNVLKPNDILSWMGSKNHLLAVESKTRHFKDII